MTKTKVRVEEFSLSRRKVEPLALLKSAQGDGERKACIAQGLISNGLGAESYLPCNRVYVQLRKRCLFFFFLINWFKEKISLINKHEANI